MKSIALTQSLILISLLSTTALTITQTSSTIRLAQRSKEQLSALQEEVGRLKNAERFLELNQKKSTEQTLENKTQNNKIIQDSSPQERRLTDEHEEHDDHDASPNRHLSNPVTGMITPSLLPPPPPIFSTGKLPVQTQYQIVHYPAHVNTPWNLLSYPRVMAPHYGYQGYPLHPYNFMHMAHAAHTAMLGGHLGAVGATMGMGAAGMGAAGMGAAGMGAAGMGHMAMGMGHGMGMNPYMHSPYSMGLHPFGYMPPVGMPYMPYATYGLGGFSSPFPYGAYGSFGYSSPMMGGMNKKSMRRERLV